MTVENPAAFPCTGEGFQSEHYTQKGMTLRDYFAGQALAGLCANPNIMSHSLFQDVVQGIRGGKHFADVAHTLADALLIERTKAGAA